MVLEILKVHKSDLKIAATGLAFLCSIAAKNSFETVKRSTDQPLFGVSAASCLGVCMVLIGYYGDVVYRGGEKEGFDILVDAESATETDAQGDILTQGLEGSASNIRVTALLGTLGLDYSDS